MTTMSLENRFESSSFLSSSRLHTEPPSIESHVNVKSEPQSTDTVTTDNHAFSEADISNMIRRAWEIKEVYERENGRLSEAQAEDPQTPATTSDMGQRNTCATRCGLMHSLHGICAIKEEIHRLATNCSLEDDISTKQEVEDKEPHKVAPHRPSSISSSYAQNPLEYGALSQPMEAPATASSQSTIFVTPPANAAPIIRLVQPGETTLVGRERRLTVANPGNLSLSHLARPVDSWLFCYPQPALVIRHLSGSYNEGYYYNYSNDSNNSNDAYQANGAFGSLGQGPGGSNTGFFTTQGSTSNGLQGILQPVNLTREDEILRLREQARKLGYDLVPRQAPPGATASLVEPPSVFLPSSAQPPPPLIQHPPYNEPLSVFLHPDISTAPYDQPWNDPQVLDFAMLDSSLLEAAGAQEWGDLPFTNQHSDQPETMQLTNSNVNFYTPTSHTQLVLPPAALNQTNITLLQHNATAGQNTITPPHAMNNKHEVSSPMDAGAVASNASRPACNKCGKTFGRQYELDDHAYYHTGVK
ncbi:hypothetical protein FRC07_004239, partial [Ceratobasidium sp. 392]